MAKNTTNTTTNTTTAAFVLRPARRAAHCVVCGEQYPKGTVMHWGHVPQCKAERGICCDCWQHADTMSEAHAVVEGVATHGGRYRFFAVVVPDGGVSDALRAAMRAANGAQPRWYADGNRIMSPMMRNAKSWKRLDTIDQHAEGGRLEVTITTASGAHVETLTYRWGKRDRLGRFTKAGARSAKPQLVGDVERAIAQYEGRGC